MTFRRVFTRAIKNYKSGVGIIFSPKYLFFTNVFLSMGISTVGDTLEQSYEVYTEQEDEIDYKRTAHMSFSGACAGVLCHHWYKFIDTVIKGRTFDQAIKKLALDQFVASPIIILSFFATVAIFEDDPLENFTDEVKDKFWTLYKAEWTVWPPAQMINFYFLPTKFRVLFDNTVSLGYDIYTSRVKHAKKIKVETNDKEKDQDTGNNISMTEIDDTEIEEPEIEDTEIEFEEINSEAEDED